MITKNVILQKVHGLHARPALKVVEKCRNFTSKVTICKGCEKADGCSVLQLMMLAAENGSELKIIAEGADEELAVVQLAELFNDGEGI